MQVVSDVGLRTTTDIQGFDVVTTVRRSAEKEHQFASHISAVMKFVAGAGEDSFGSVNALITDLIDMLQKEASAETSHKAYHKEMAKSTEKKEDLEAQVAKHSSQLESAVARSNTLAGEVAELPADLYAVAAQQLKMDTLRGEERKIFATAREDLEQGIAGIQKVSGIFRDNCGASFIQQPDAPEVHTKSHGAGSSIISILSVIESDLSKNLIDLSLCHGAGGRVIIPQTILRRCPNSRMSSTSRRRAQI